VRGSPGIFDRQLTANADGERRALNAENTESAEKHRDPAGFSVASVL